MCVVSRVSADVWDAVVGFRFRVWGFGMGAFGVCMWREGWWFYENDGGFVGLGLAVLGVGVGGAGVWE